MSDTAKDCTLSAGNLYRRFKSEDGIITGIAVRWFCERKKLLRETIDNNRKKSFVALPETLL